MDSASKTSRSATYLFILGLTVCLIGAVLTLTMLVGARVTALPAQSLVPLKFNTLVALTLLGAGMAATARRKNGVGRGMGLVVLLIGLLTGFEYISGRSLGFDELVVTDHSRLTDGEIAGRMAPNTAVVFVIFGLSLLAMGSKRVPSRLCKTYGSVILAISSLALLGRGTGLNDAFRWGHHAGMHMFTAYCFCALSCGQIYWSVEVGRRRGHRSAWSFPFFTTGAAMILVLSSIIYSSTVSEEAASRWITHTDEVIQQLDVLDRAVMGAETNFRGYLISPADDYRQTLDNHRLEADVAVDIILALTSDNPQQQHRIPELRTRLHAAFTTFRQNMTGPVANPAATVQEGRRLRQPLRALIDEMRAEEMRLRTIRLDQEQDSKTQLRGTVIVGCVIILGFFGVAVFLTLQAEGLQAAAEARLLTTNVELETRIAARTQELRDAIDVEVTARKEADRLRIAEESAREASRLKSDFLANMSHEIRTPMNGVIGMTALLLDMPQPPEQREMTKVIQSSADSLLTIINDILDFSKIEAGKLRIDATDFDLKQLVEESLSVLAPRAHEKNIELLSDFAPHLPVLLRGDAGRIRQVLTNLVGNAIKFTLSGEVVVLTKPTRITADRVGFRIEVVDTGIGIPEHAQENIFKAFEQADGSTTRKFGGTGLGLSISRQLVELMVGSMGFRSEVAKGSTFWFELELPRATTQRIEVLPELPKGGHALLVDDNANNRRILSATLEKIGFTSESVANASEALSSIYNAGKPYTVIILDKNMPGMDGVQVAEKIRRSPGTASLPIILLSSSATPSEEAKSLQAAVLTKPVREIQLRHALAQVLSITPAGIPAATPRIREAGQKLKLLLADDNATNQLVGQLLLQRMGHTVDVAEDGPAVLKALENNTYDAVFMDCQMPEMDGYETTRRIRAGQTGPKNAGLPIIALTAYAMPSDRIKCLESGMNDYISKPLRIDDVTNVLSRAVVRHETAWAQEESVEPTLDRATLQQLRGLSGADDIVAQVIDLFRQDGPKQLEALRAAFQSGDTSRLSHEAHLLAGSCGALGGRHARWCSMKVEEASRKSDRDALGRSVAALSHAVGVLIEELDKFQRSTDREV